MAYAPIDRKLAAGGRVLLDGGLGTEILRQGACAEVGLWAVAPLLNAPESLRQIHETYVAAGAEVLTTATFRTSGRSLAAIGRGADADRLTRGAVRIAQEARERSRADRSVAIAGSLAPVGDCYRPAEVPGDDVLLEEHRTQARRLADAGVDLLLAETMNTVREARAALVAGLETGLPVWVSLVCGDGARLLSGETLKQAADALMPLAPAALLVNCSTPERTTAAITALRGPHSVPLGAYANNGEPDEEAGWRFNGQYPPARYAAEARGWLDLGARIVGGCCGTTPEHIRTLREAVDLPAERRATT
jgi:S-methylmethionine-dependent homocysteine/selenocysteine methylase